MNVDMLKGKLYGLRNIFHDLGLSGLVEKSSGDFEGLYEIHYDLDANTLSFSGKINMLVNFDSETIGFDFFFIENHDLFTSLIVDVHRKYKKIILSHSKKLGDRSNPLYLVYKITNKRTGKCYVGKSNSSFATRWYDHFKNNKNSKFGQEISDSEITDWTFEILENVSLRHDEDFDTTLLKRERFWIDHFDSLNNGYNSR